MTVTFDSRIILYLVAILSPFFLHQLPKSKLRSVYAIIMCSLICLESGLRGLTVGPDTPNYYRWFQSVKDLDWNSVFELFRKAYLQGTEKDPGYTFFLKVYQTFNSDFQLFLLFIAIPYSILLGKFFLKYTETLLELAFAFILYISLFQILALSGIRQQIATTIILYLYVYNNRLNIKLILFLALAATIHISSLVTLGYFLLLRVLSKRNTVFFLRITPFLFFIGLSIGRAFVGLLADAVGNEYYKFYIQGENLNPAFTGAFLAFALSCVAALSYKSIIPWRFFKEISVAIILYGFLSPFILIDGGLIRIPQYFGLFYCVAFPRLIVYFAIRDYKTYLILILICNLSAMPCSSSLTTPVCL